jgi:ornithine decarboxylase
MQQRIDINDYFTPEAFKRIKDLADTQETPFVVVDKATVAEHYDDLVRGFPVAKIYYAVKANPADELIALLRDKGSNFDIASIYELDKVMKPGVRRRIRTALVELGRGPIDRGETASTLVRFLWI